MIYNNAVTKNKNVPVMVNVNKKVSITNDFERIQANSDDDVQAVYHNWDE